MREILFKAKRIDNEEWVEGYYSPHPHPFLGFLKDYIFAPYYDKEKECGYDNGYQIDVNTLCQYTGLTDKNGNRIWENDIMFDDDIASLVRWDEEEARFVIDDYGTKGCLMEYGFDEDAGEFGVVDTNGFVDFATSVSEIFEVIGNVFDNPELLEGGGRDE